MSNSFGRQVVLPLTNKSGGGVVAGDVVILDSSNNGAFTTTTSASVTTPIGIAQETIASNAVGRVLLYGYAALVNVNASVTRFHYGATYTVAKQATDAGAVRLAGTTMIFLTGGATPDALLYPVDLAGAALTNPMSTTGDLILGGASGTPTRLAITVPAANILNVPGVVNGETTWSVKPIHDGTAPVNQAFGDTATAGTALTAAHRDHKHGMPAGFSPSVVAAHNSSDLSISSGSERDMTMNTDDHDPDGYHGTDNVFTVPTGKGGGFLASWDLRFSGAPGDGYVVARVSTNIKVLDQLVASSAAGVYATSGSQVIVLADADALTWKILTSNTVNIQAAGTGVWASITKIW